MKLKLSLIFLLIMFSILPLNAMTIEGGISYTVSKAREIAFNNLPIKIPKSSFENFLNYKKRNSYRYATIEFSDNTFGLIDKKNKRGYYYTEKGKLYLIQIKINEGKYNKYARYDLNGNLDSVALGIDNQQFLFDLNKKLIAHWIGKNGYDENGELFGTRD